MMPFVHQEPTFKNQVLDAENETRNGEDIEEDMVLQDDDVEQQQPPLIFEGLFAPPNNNRVTSEEEAATNMNAMKQDARHLRFKDQVVPAHPPHDENDASARKFADDSPNSELSANGQVDPENIGAALHALVPVGQGVLVRENTDVAGDHGSLLPIAEVERINPFFQKKCVLTLAGLGLVAIALAVTLPLVLIQPEPLSLGPTMAPTSASIGDGVCDAEFNALNNNLDGGDCCEQTCESLTPFSGCGKENDGFTFVGYDSCTLVQRSVVSGPWIPNGQPVDASETFSFSGAALEISPNGQILLVGEYGSNSARLFDKDGSVWRQRGPTLEGPPGSDFGRSVAMAVASSTSRRMNNPATLVPVTIAIGGSAHADDGGIVRVYDCMTTGCFQVGNDIAGQGGCNGFCSDRLGRSVDISNDGRLLVLTGREGVRTYERRNRSYGIRDTLTPPSSSYEPIYVALTGDGDTLAVGYLKFVLQDAPEPSSHVLATRVYNDIGGAWNQTDEEIAFWSHHLYSFARERYPQSSVRISNDGSVLAIATQDDQSSGTDTARVHILRRANETWNMADIVSAPDGVNAKEDLFGWSLDLSEDGSKIAITSVDMISLFEWNRTNYQISTTSSSAGEENAVSLSRDGSIVAVGFPFSNDTIGGRTVTYGNVSPPCPENTVRIRLSLTTGINADQIRWTLTDKYGFLLREGGSYETDGREATFVEEVCVDNTTIAEGCVVFSIAKSNADTSVYSVFLEDEEIQLSGNPNFETNDLPEFDHRFDQLGLGSACPCEDGQAQFRLVLETDHEPEEMSWSLTNGPTPGSVPLLSGGPYDPSTQQRTLFIANTCVAEDECAVFTLRDTGRNGFGSDPTGLFGVGGYSLFWNGEEVVADTPDGQSDFKVEAVHRLGASCAPTIAPTPVPVECDAATKPVRIELTLGEFFPSAISWTISDSAIGDIFLQGGPYNSSHINGVVADVLCLDRDACAVLTVNSASAFSSVQNLLVLADGKEVFNGRPFAARGAVVERIPIGNCTSPIATLSPTPAPTSVLGCPSGSKLFQFNFTTDTVTEGTSWDLSDTTDGFLLGVDSYTAPVNGFALFTDETCVGSTFSCTTLSIRFCCGPEGAFTAGMYSASVDGVVVASGATQLGGVETVQFGNCLTTIFLP